MPINTVLDISTNKCDVERSTALYFVPLSEIKFRKNNPSKLKKGIKFWRVLLDSGSDGDVIFIKKNKKCHFPVKRKRQPQTWKTSCGQF